MMQYKTTNEDKSAFSNSSSRDELCDVYETKSIHTRDPTRAKLTVEERQERRDRRGEAGEERDSRGEGTH